MRQTPYSIDLRSLGQAEIVTLGGLNGCPGKPVEKGVGYRTGFQGLGVGNELKLKDR